MMILGLKKRNVRAAAWSTWICGHIILGITYIDGSVKRHSAIHSIKWKSFMKDNACLIKLVVVHAGGGGPISNLLAL